MSACATSDNLEQMRSRRDFLSLPVFLLSRNLSAARELDCDVAVIGGGTGGCAPGLAAARNGLRVILTEGTDWLGGGPPPPAVPPPAPPRVRTFGRRPSPPPLRP